MNLNLTDFFFYHNLANIGFENQQYEQENEQEDEQSQYEKEQESLFYGKISCVQIVKSFIIFGTTNGYLYILSLEKKQAKPTQFRFNEPILNLSVDNFAKYICVHFENYSVQIIDFASNQIANFSSSLKIVKILIDPNYSSNSVNERLIVLNKKGTLNLRSKELDQFQKETYIYSLENGIKMISWSNSLIAFGNSEKLLIYNVNKQEIISSVLLDTDLGENRKLSQNQDYEVYEIKWKEPEKQIFILSQNQMFEYNFNIKTSKLNFVKKYHFSFIVCGFGFFFEHLILLTVDNLDELMEIQNRINKKLKNDENFDLDEDIASDIFVDLHFYPQLRLISIASSKEEDVVTLPLQGAGISEPKELRLLSNHEDFTAFFFSSPQQILKGSIKQNDQTIDWLLENGKYKDCLFIAKNPDNFLNKYSLEKLNEYYVHHLFYKQKYEKAAAICNEICQKNPELWPKWIFNFVQHNQAIQIIDYIPFDENLYQLKPECYEMFLNSVFQKNENFQRLHDLIKTSPAHFYDIETLLEAFLVRKNEFFYKNEELYEKENSDEKNNLDEINEKNLIKAQTRDFYLFILAHFYKLLNRYDEYFFVQIKLGDANSFDNIDRIQDSSKLSLLIQDLVDLDPQKAIELIVEKMDKFPLDAVVDQLNYPKYRSDLFLYLKRVFELDQALLKDHQLLVVELYIEFSPSSLLNSFLEYSNYLPLEEVLEICEKNKMYQETTFILSKLGKRLEVLQNLLYNERNFTEALNFVSSENDRQLRKELFMFCKNNPEYFPQLLESVPKLEFRLTDIIYRIPKGIEIKELGTGIQKLVRQFSQKVSLVKSLRNCVSRDSSNLALDLNDKMRQGVQVSHFCSYCGAQFEWDSSEIIVSFFCGHAYHQICLVSYFGNSNYYCVRCGKSKESLK